MTKGFNVRNMAEVAGWSPAAREVIRKALEEAPEAVDPIKASGYRRATVEEKDQFKKLRAEVERKFAPPPPPKPEPVRPAIRWTATAAFFFIRRYRWLKNRK